MYCRKCGTELTEGYEVCHVCGTVMSDFYLEQLKNAPPDAESFEQREVKVNAGIYKLLCVCMALCLVAGSVVWAALFMRDRMATSSSASRKPSTEALAVNAEPVESTKKTTTTTSVTTTTTTTTTTDPYKVTVTPEKLDYYGTMFTITDGIIMRIGPGYDYEPLEQKIPSGVSLAIDSERFDPKSNEKWCYVTYEGNSGWISRTFLSNTNPYVAVIKPDEMYSGYQRDTVSITRMGGLNLYSGPGEEYDIILTLKEGDEITNEGYNYFSVKWAYVSYGGQFGWIKTYDGDWFNRTIE